MVAPRRQSAKPPKPANLEVEAEQDETIDDDFESDASSESEEEGSDWEGKATRQSYFNIFFLDWHANKDMSRNDYWKGSSQTCKADVQLKFEKASSESDAREKVTPPLSRHALGYTV